MLARCAAYFLSLSCHEDDCCDLILTLFVIQIVPLALRGLTTCLIALSFTVGPFIVALIVNFHGNTGDAWSYRAVFCSQYGLAVIAAAFVFFMPE